MKYLTVLLLLIIPLSAAAENTNEDSLLFFQQIQDLIDQQQYATAHILLSEKIKQEELNPVTTCWLVENGLKNNYKHDRYEIFYLKDADHKMDTVRVDSIRNVRAVRLHFPDRLLQRIINRFPNYARSHKLMGDYFDLQLLDLGDSEIIDQQKAKILEEKIFQHYSEAVKLGCRDVYVNRWLGTYYLNLNQIELAAKYYLKNTGRDLLDPVSLFRLGEISFQKKEYSRAHSYAMDALKHFSPEDVYLKYDATRLAARSLRALGETDRFRQLINENIETLPDLQEAYLDLAAYYEDNRETEPAEQALREMLLNNPFERRGFRFLENYICRHQSFFFADTLFDELLVAYENWDDALANIYWSRGNLAAAQNLPSEAANFWEIARNYMRRYLPENSPLLHEVGKSYPKKISN